MVESTTIEAMPPHQEPPPGLSEDVRRAFIGIVPTVIIALLTAWGMYSYDKGQREESFREFRTDIQDIKQTLKDTSVQMNTIGTKVANIEGRLAGTKIIP